MYVILLSVLFSAPLLNSITPARANSISYALFKRRLVIVSSLKALGINYNTSIFNY
jgi:hypothetical protein